MKNISTNFKTLTKKIKQQDCKITIIDTNKPLKIKDTKYSFEGQLFKTIMKQIIVTAPVDSSLKGKKLNFQY